MRAILAALVLLGWPSEPHAQDVVSADEAVAAFAEICLDSAPAFDDAEARMAARSLVRQEDTGTFYHATGTLSAKVAEYTTRSGEVYRRCSVVLEDPDGERVLALIDAALAARDYPQPLAGPQKLDDGALLWTTERRIGGGTASVSYFRIRPDMPHSGIAVDFFGG